MLIELAERCEKATGPDRELDLRIEQAVNPEYEGMDEEHARFLTKYGGQRPFTASVDAAMTLVSEGYQWAVGSWGNPDTDGPWAWCATEQQSWEMDLDYAAAATPALALCAAALRARAGESHEAP